MKFYASRRERHAVSKSGRAVQDSERCNTTAVCDIENIQLEEGGGLIGLKPVDFTLFRILVCVDPHT